MWTLDQSDRTSPGLPGIKPSSNSPNSLSYRVRYEPQSNCHWIITSKTGSALCQWDKAKLGILEFEIIGICSEFQCEDELQGAQKKNFKIDSTVNILTNLFGYGLLLLLLQFEKFLLQHLPTQRSKRKHVEGPHCKYFHLNYIFNATKKDILWL